MANKLQKPHLTKVQVSNIHWLNNPKNKDAIRIGRYQEYWILSQNEPDSSVLVYDQTEWDAFVDGVNKREFDDLANE